MRMPFLPEIRTTVFALGALVMAQACSPDVEKSRAATSARMTDVTKVAPTPSPDIIPSDIATTSEPETRSVDPTDYSLCNPAVDGSVMADWKDSTDQPWVEPRRHDNGFPTTVHPLQLEKAVTYMDDRGFYEATFTDMFSSISTGVSGSTNPCSHSYMFFRKNAEGATPDIEAALDCQYNQNGAHPSCHWDGYTKTADGWDDIVKNPLYVGPKRDHKKAINPDVLKCAAQNAFPWSGFKPKSCQ